MKLTFLGVSSALSEGYNSNVLIEDKETVILFDCGEDIKHSLKAAGRKVEELDSIYISHLHSDHCYGLSWIGYYSYFILQKRIALYIHESMVSDLWGMLRPAMEKIHGKGLVTLSEYFDIHIFDVNYFVNIGPFVDIGPFAIYPSRQKHVITPSGNIYSFGARFYGRGNRRFFISSDTCKLELPNETVSEFDYIFCDCDVMNLSGAHSNYNDLKKIPENIRRRVWLYHYTDLSKYNKKYGEMPDAVADGFAGFVKEGQVFEF